MISEARIDYLKSLYTPSKNLKFSDILAICDKESSGVEYFTDKDKLFHDNIRAAMKITGLSKKEILEEVLISKPVYNTFFNRMFGIQDQPARYIKFRCEPSIWNIVKGFKEFTVREKFLLASSVGVGQRLTYYYIANSKKPKSQWIVEIKKFAVDVKLQMREISVNMSWWLYKAKDNKELAFTMYNRGYTTTVSSYGKSVAALAQLYKKYD